MTAAVAMSMAKTLVDAMGAVVAAVVPSLSAAAGASVEAMSAAAGNRGGGVETGKYSNHRKYPPRGVQTYVLCIQIKSNITIFIWAARSDKLI